MDRERVKGPARISNSRLTTESHGLFPGSQMRRCMHRCNPNPRCRARTISWGNTYPVPPVAGVVAVSVACEIVHSEAFGAPRLRD